MEWNTSFAAALLQNRNDLESMHTHNFMAFFLYIYMCTNALLTPALIEGALYGQLQVLPAIRDACGT